MKRHKLVEYLPVVAIGVLALAVAVRMRVVVPSARHELPTWRGVPVWKTPGELWLLQEIVHKTQPDVIVETGTFKGGSALFLASLLDFRGSGKVVSVDIKDLQPRPKHDRITYLIGSSVDPSVVRQVKAAISPGGTVLVDLDSAHDRAHVLAELRAYADVVSVGSYIVVEDAKSARALLPDRRRQPGQAVDEFLSENPNFVSDPSWPERLGVESRSEYLRRVR